MKVEIFTNNKFKNVVKNNGFDATRLYRRNINNTPPYYEIWEVEKSDVKNIEIACMTEDVFFCYSIGEHRGTAFECLTINNQFVIGWTAKDNKDTFDNLMDYFTNGLGIIDMHTMAAYSVSLAKSNGWTLSKTWKLLEG